MTAALLVVVTAVGIPVAGQLEKIHGEDPSLVVIDEVAGMLVTYLGVSAGLLGWVAGFFWFRFFDILKPFGVRKLEKLGGGGRTGHHGRRYRRRRAGLPGHPRPRCCILARLGW